MAAEEIAAHLGREVTLARKRIGISQRRFAARLELDPSFVNHIEAGRRLPSMENLYAMADVLGVEAVDLLPLRMPPQGTKPKQGERG